MPPTLDRSSAPPKATSLSVLTLEFAFHAASRVPPPLLDVVASILATLDWIFSSARRDGLRHNLAAIAEWGHPRLSTESQRRDAEFAVFRSYHRACLGYLAHRRGGRASFRATRFAGTERLYGALSTGRGTVVTAPHLGNWELAGLAMARLGFKVHVVTGVQFHASVARAVRAAKEAERVAVSTPEDGFLPLLRTLRGGGLVVLLADGDVHARGETVRFFGAPAEFPVGPALLARRADVPIVHAYAVREQDGGERIVFESVDRPDRALPVADDVARLTEGVVRAIERAVAAHVTQWCIFRPFVGAGVEPEMAPAPIATNAI